MRRWSFSQWKCVGLWLALPFALAAQGGIFPLLPAVFGHFDLLLVLAVYGTIALGFERTLYWALGAGLLFGLVAPVSFGVPAVRLIAAVIAVSWCARHVVTNRTLAAVLALGLVGVFFDGGSGAVAAWISSAAGFSPWPWLSGWSWEWLGREAAALGAELVVLGGAYLWQQHKDWAWGAA